MLAKSKRVIPSLLLTFFIIALVSCDDVSTGAFPVVTMDLEDVHIQLCVHEDFSECQESKLVDGGEINISKGSKYHDSISSAILFAPSNVSIELCEHHTYDKRANMNCSKWHGENRETIIRKTDLERQNLHDNISSLRWFVNGALYLESAQETESDIGKTTRIVIYEHDEFKGEEEVIYLRNGGLVNISPNHSLHDEISSFELFASSRVIVELCKHHLTGDESSKCKKWRGKGRLRIDQDDLEDYGLQDSISAIRWYVIDEQTNRDRLVPGVYTLRD